MLYHSLLESFKPNLQQKFRWSVLRLTERACPIDSAPMTRADLLQLQKGVNLLFSRLDIHFDIAGPHFLERLNDPRNDRNISMCELVEFFKAVYFQHAEQIKKLPDQEQAVLRDVATKLNIPFVKIDGGPKQDDTIKAKTIMRKDRFMTQNPTINIDSKVTVS